MEDKDKIKENEKDPKDEGQEKDSKLSLTDKKDPKNSNEEDKNLQIESLKELISELKQQNESVTNELRDIKKEQIKMTEMYGSNSKVDDGQLFSIFDKYEGGKNK